MFVTGFTIFLFLGVLIFSVHEALSADKIKVGAPVSLTGMFSKPGNHLRDGYEFWQDWVNNRGGIKVGNKTYTVEMVYYDDKSDAMTSAKLTEKLITEDKVNFIFAPYSSGITTATAAISEKYRYITIGSLANADALYERGYKYLFSVNPPSSREMVPIMELVVNLEPKPKTFAVITADNLFSLMAAQGIQKRGKELGLQEVYYGKYPLKSTDLSPVLSMVKSKNPDLLFCGTLLEDSVLVMKQSKEIGLSPKLISFSVGPPLDEFTQVLGKDANYACGRENWAKTMNWKGGQYPGAEEYGDLFEKKYGRVATFYSASGTVAGFILQVAVEKAQSLDQDKVREAVSKLDIETLYGPIKFNEQGKNIAAVGGVMQIQNQQRVIVSPRPAPGVKLLYPTPAWDKR